MSRWFVVAGGVVVVLAIVAVVLALSGDDEETGLPEVEGTEAPEAYRIVYEVTNPEGVGREEHVVHRPFDAHIVQRDSSGTVTSERWSTLGQLVTRSQGGPAVRIDTAIAPAASDLRPERFAERLESAEKLLPGKDGAVGGRPCRRVKEAGKVVTAPDEDATGAEDRTGSLTALIERCVDAQGLVLEERWTTAGGQRVLTKRAIDLELGDDVPAVDLPDADPLPDAQGNGAVNELSADAAPPFVEAWRLAPPDGFTFVGRYAVVPARLSQSPEALATDPSVALYTDVWRRGPDVLLLDQGASTTGSPPFDPSSAIGTTDLPALGRAVLAVDLRIAEIRLTRPEGGFVRLAGTIDLAELTALAASLELVEPAA